MNILFVEEARREFLDVIAYYAETGSELALRFKSEVDQSIKWAAENPELYPLRHGGYRRVRQPDESAVFAFLRGLTA